MVSLLALNLAAPPKERARMLLEWLWPQPEDLWVLSDLGRGDGAGLIRDVCTAADFEMVKTGRVMIVRRNLGLTALPPIGDRVCPVLINGLRVLGVYGAASDPVRYSSSAQRAAKRAWLSEFEGLVASYDLVVGDLNIAPAKSLPYVLDEEVALYADKPLLDAWGDQPDEPSWVDHTGVGLRYDQAWVSQRVRVEQCSLDHEPRTLGITDHSALRVSLHAVSEAADPPEPTTAPARDGVTTPPTPTPPTG